MAHEGVLYLSSHDSVENKPALPAGVAEHVLKKKFSVFHFIIIASLSSLARLKDNAAKNILKCTTLFAVWHISLIIEYLCCLCSACAQCCKYCAQFHFWFVTLYVFPDYCQSRGDSWSDQS